MTTDKTVFDKLAKAQKGSVSPGQEKGEPTKKQTLYLPESVHEQLREAAHALRIPQQEIFRQALDLWFAEKDLPLWREVVERAAGERSRN